MLAGVLVGLGAAIVAGLVLTRNDRSLRRGAADYFTRRPAVTPRDSRTHDVARLDSATCKALGPEPLMMFLSRPTVVRPAPGRSVAPGHAFVAVYRPVTPRSAEDAGVCGVLHGVGFYPDERDALAVVGTAGVLLVDTVPLGDAAVHRAAMRLTPAEDAQLDSAMQAFSGSHPYEIAGENCVAFVHDVARRVGLRVPPRRPITLPESYVDSLIALNPNRLRRDLVPPPSVFPGLRPAPGGAGAAP